MFNIYEVICQDLCPSFYNRRKLSINTTDRKHASKIPSTMQLFYSFAFLLFSLSIILAHDDYFDRFRFTNVVLFGDSHTDTKNIYKLSRRAWPLSPPYYRGRYCNGPNWVDQLKVPGIDNYAYGGATTDNAVVQGYAAFRTFEVPGVRQQVDLYLNTTAVSKINFATTLYIFWAGGNDLLFKPTLVPPQIVSSLLNSVNYLLGIGAKHVLIFNQMPAQYIPAALGLTSAANLAQLTAWSNIVLNTSVSTMQQTYSQAVIKVFDINTLMTKVVTSQSGYFTNATASCWNAVNITTVIKLCKNPDKFVFLDNIHMASSVHELIADAVRDYLLPSFDVNRSKYYIP